MKRAECLIGMKVQDTRSGATYSVVGERVYATDCGAWVEQIDPHEHVGGACVYDVGVIHWSHLEEVSPDGTS